MRNCPLCTTEIPDGAVVCRGCGATETLNGTMLKWAFFFGLFYVVIGGTATFRGLAHMGKGKEYSDALAIGLTILLVGAPILYFFIRQAGRKVWVRSI